GLSCNMALLLTVVFLVVGGLVVGNLVSYSLRSSSPTASSSTGGGVMPPATSTAAATPPAIATGTPVPTSSHLYPPSNEQLVLSDPLQDNSKSYQWNEHAGCQFTGGA